MREKGGRIGGDGCGCGDGHGGVAAAGGAGAGGVEPDHALAGRDSSRLLAKGRLEPESAAEAAEPLRRDELETLREWRELFEFKYVRLGPLEGWRGHAPPQDAPGEGDMGQAAIAARLAEEFGDS